MFPVSYCISLWLIYFVCSTSYLSTPSHYLSRSPFPLPSGNHCFIFFFFSLSVSLFLFCYCHSFVVFFRFRIKVLSYSICLSLSDLSLASFWHHNSFAIFFKDRVILWFSYLPTICFLKKSAFHEGGTWSNKGKKKDICIEVGRVSNSDFWKYDMRMFCREARGEVMTRYLFPWTLTITWH